MKAIIELDVPGFQIGQEVTVYFKDTMQTKGVCVESPVVRCKDCKHHDYCYTRPMNGRDWFCADGKRKE